MVTNGNYRGVRTPPPLRYTEFKEPEAKLREPIKYKISNKALDRLETFTIIAAFIFTVVMVGEELITWQVFN